MKKWIIIGACVLLAIIAANTCLFTLRENETAIVLRFGKITEIYVQEASDQLRADVAAQEGEGVTVHEGAGLKFKLPFVDQVITYSYSSQNYENNAYTVHTSDSKILEFNSYAQWRIENPAQFYRNLQTVSRANARIDTTLYSHMNERVGKIKSETLISNRVKITEMLDELVLQMAEETASMGITILDIRIKRTDVPSGNYESIYERMITNRNRIAAQYRSEGDEEAMEIRSKADKDATEITSKANRDAEKIKGEADLEAANIFNEAYAANPEFYEFYNMLDVYRETIGQSSTLVIPLDSPFAKYLLGVSDGAFASNVPTATPSPEPAGE